MTAEIIDQANELEEMLREQAIAAHRINRNAVSAKHCAECGEDIPEPRRGHTGAEASGSPRVPNVCGVPGCYRTEE